MLVVSEEANLSDLFTEQRDCPAPDDILGDGDPAVLAPRPQFHHDEVAEERQEHDVRQLNTQKRRVCSQQL